MGRYLQGVRCDIKKVNAFFGQKYLFLKPNFNFLKHWKRDIYEYLKTFQQIANLCHLIANQSHPKFVPKIMFVF